MWYWPADVGYNIYFDKGETVRFRVQEEKWHDQIPNAPDLQEESLTVERKPPYSIIVRILPTVP